MGQAAMRGSELREWRVLPDGPDAERLASAFGSHPLVARILAQRGFRDVRAALAFVDPVHYQSAAPEELPDLALATDLLQDAIVQQRRVLIWGDFDVDGQTATALLKDGLTRLGLTPAYYVPHRLRESHGILVESLAAQLEALQPDILLTCDTGITAHEAVDYARARNLTVIVTDHHDLAETLPSAHAVVNPKRLPPAHPLRTLPGVGVAYKLMQALYARYDRAAEVEELLDLVALGIVADVAELTGDTRYLLQIGMGHLRQTRRLGLQMLFEVAGILPEHVTAEDIGFQLGPRLNAVGRLGDATQAVELLTTDDPIQARVTAAALDALNKKRQVMQRDLLAGALEMIARNPELLDHTALVLSQRDWHPGLLGIVAGQLAEQYRRPCVLLSESAESEVARGSARSSPGYDIGSALAQVADLLIAFGGHPGAAGMSLKVEDVARFRRRLSQVLEVQYRPAAIPVLDIAAMISLSEVTDGLGHALDWLSPFGEGNPPVVLAVEKVHVVSQRILGRERLHRKLVVQDSDQAQREVLWWNGVEHTLPEGLIDLAFTVGWNTYQGRRSLAMTLVDLRPCSVEEEVAPVPRLELIDWRGKTIEEALLAYAVAESEGLIWAEVVSVDTPRVCRRVDLHPASALLVISLPPSPAVLVEAIESVSPARLYFVGVPSLDQSLPQFVRRLAALCKYTLSHRSGETGLELLASAAGQTVEVVYWGLRLLVAGGQITMREQDDRVILAPGVGRGDPQAEAEAQAALRIRFAEVSAFRQFARRVPLESLLG